MEKNNKRKAELGERVEGRGVLLVAEAETPDGILHDLIKMLEDHIYEVFKCNGVDGFLSQMKKNRIDIILTEENLLDPMYKSHEHLTKILRGMNLPVIMISSNDNIKSHYHWLAGYIVRPILELVEKLFCDRINKSGDVKRLKEEIEHVELPDVEKRLKEEVEDAELPNEENKKKLEREKAGEHHQRMVWTGDREQMFVKIVTELDKNGKATGKQVWELMQANGFKDISLKQVNSHLQKHRGKLKNVHPVDSSSRIWEYKDQVDTSPGQDACRHGMEEHSSKTDAPIMNTINGNLNSTSQKHHLITESLNYNMQGNFGNPNILYNGGNFENGKGKDIIQDRNCMDDDFIGTSLTQVLPSSPKLVDATPLIIESFTMGGCQGNSSMTMEGNFGNPNILYNGGNFENEKGKDIIQDWNCMDDDFIGTSLTQVLPSSPKLVDATPLIIESSTMGGCQGNSSMTMEGNFGNPNILYKGGNFENGKGKDIIQDQNYMDDDFIGPSLTQVLLSSPKLVDATSLIIESSTMGGCQGNSSMTMEGNFGNPNILYNGGNFENRKGKDIIQDQNCMDDDFIGTSLTQVLLSSPKLVDATPIIIESSTMGGCQGNSSMTMEGNFGNPNILYNGGNFENGKGKDIIQDWNCIDNDFIGTSLTQVLPSSPKLVDTTPLIIESSTMGGCQSNSSMTMEGQPSSLFVNDIPGQAFDKNGSGLQSEEYGKVYTPQDWYYGDFDFLSY